MSVPRPRRTLRGLDLEDVCSDCPDSMGVEVRDVARVLGIKCETLWNWVSNALRDRDAAPAVLSSDERPELARLRRKVAELKVEKEVLKKAAVVNA